MSLSVGVIGGGQLARMMIPAAIELGIEIQVLGESDEASARAAVSMIGDATDAAAVLEFAAGVDVVTFDHEHVPQPILRELIARGVQVRPGPDALLYAQDKLLMRERLGILGLPVPDWARVSDAGELAAFLADHDGRAVVKTPRGGYDGKGVRVVTSPDEVSDWLADGKGLLAEELVEFRRELAQLVARRPSGEIAAWPLVETVQRGGVCAEVFAPAPRAAGALSDMASDIAYRVAEGLGVTGVLAV